MKRLEQVELGRAVAACAVVGFHANVAARFHDLASISWASPLANGVDFFFVLSGFIIVWVHRGDVGRPALALSYLWKRFVRLFPLLWLVVGGYILLQSLRGKAPSPEAIGTSLLLYPSLAEPLPIVVWTLRHELLFYLAFCVAIANRRAGIALFALWTAAVSGQMVLIALGRPVGGVASLILSPFMLDFAMGGLVAMIAARHRVRSWFPLILGLAMVVAFGALSVILDLRRTAPFEYVSVRELFIPLNGLPFAVLLYGMVCVEDRVKVPRWGVLLGGASYAIYLVHVPVNLFVPAMAARLGNGLGHAVIILAGIGAGVLVHILFERPITRALRRLSPFSSASGSEKPARPLPSGSARGSQER